MLYTSKGVIIGCLFCAIVFIIIAFVIKGNSDYELATFDREIEGTVGYSTAYHTTDSDGKDEIRYEITVYYDVGDTSYSCRERGFKSYKDAGTKLMVYFASDYPDKAILHKPGGADFKFWIVFIVGSIMGVVGIGALIRNIIIAIRNLADKLKERKRRK